MGIGINFNRLQISGFLPGQWVKFGNGIDFVAKQRNAPGTVFQVGRKNLYRVTARSEAGKGAVRLLQSVYVSDNAP